MEFLWQHKKVEAGCHPRSFVFSINIQWALMSQRWCESQWKDNKLRWSSVQVVGNRTQNHSCQNTSSNFIYAADVWFGCTQLGISMCLLWSIFFFFFTDNLLCPAQPDSSICVGVFLHGLWKMSKLLVCLLRYGQCSFLSASAAN